MNIEVADIHRAERLPLWKPHIWNLIPFDKKIACYNGVGADRFPVFILWILSTINPLFLPAVVIHDFDYTYYKNGYSGFTISNLRLAVNMILCCIYLIFDVRKLILILFAVLNVLFLTLIVVSFYVLNVLFAPFKILIYPLICQLFGWHGYCVEKK